MANIFICPKCGSLLSGWKPENCGQCGCAVKNEDGNKVTAIEKTSIQIFR